MSKKIMSMLMLVLLLFTSLSCTSENNDEVNDTTAEDTAAAENTEGEETSDDRLYPDIPDIDWEGENFHVMGRTTARPQFISFDIYAEAENGETVNDAVFRRNREIEEKYNVTITQFLSGDPQGDLSRLVSAGDDVYDLAMLVQYTVKTPAQNGELIDLNSLKYVDFDKPWWNKELNEHISIFNKLYFTTSDFLLMDKQRTSIMFFNREMAEEYALGNLFDIVRDGKWTIDFMTEMAKTVSGDVDGDGDMDQHDRFGVGFEYYNTSVLAFALGNTICGKYENDQPTLFMNTPRMASSIEKILMLCADKSIMFYVNDYEGIYEGDYWHMGQDNFEDGRVLFYATFPQAFKEMSAECEFEYGVVPFPKYDEAQETHHTLAAQALFLTVPITVSNPDFTGFMLEALSAYSSYTTLPAFYEVSCKTKYMYDADSAEMLDITFDGLVYDLGQLYDWGGLFSLLGVTIPGKLENNFASLYAAAESKALAEMEKTIEIFMELDR